MRYNELRKLLENNGWYFQRQASGNHEIWLHEKANRPLTIPNHGAKEFSKGLEKRLIATIKKVNN